MFKAILRKIYQPALNVLEELGGIGIMFLQSVYWSFRRPF